MKELLKLVARIVATILVIPIWLMYYINAWLSNRDSSLQSVSQFVSVIPGVVGRYMRVAFYRLVLDKCEWSVTFEFGTLLSKCNASFGSNVYIGPYCQLGMVTLEEDVLLGPAVQIPSGGKMHNFDSLEVPIREQGGVKSMVTIGRDSWIGSGAIILCDVSEQTIVGAGSVLTKQYPARSILAGNPARVLRTRGASAPQ